MCHYWHAIDMDNPIKDQAMKVLAKQLLAGIMSDKRAQSDPAVKRAMELFQNVNTGSFSMVMNGNTIEITFKTKDGDTHFGTLS